MKVPIQLGTHQVKKSIDQFNERINALSQKIMRLLWGLQVYTSNVQYVVQILTNEFNKLLLTWQRVWASNYS